MALRDVLQAIVRDWRVVRRADLDRHAGAHAAVKTLAGVLLEERDEAQGRAERLGQSQQAALEKLSVCQRDAQGVRAALDASERGLLASQAALAERSAALTTAQGETGAARAEMDALRRQLAEADSEKADLAAEADAANSRADALRARLAGLPPDPPPMSAPSRMPAQWCREQIARHLTAFLPSDILNITWADSYPVFEPDTLKPLLAYWKQYVMPPNDDPAERFVCRKRALSLAAFMDKQIGRPLFIFSGTHPYALGPDGRPGPHIWNGALDKTGALWLVDPTWIPDLIIPWPAGAKASQSLGL